MTRKAGSLFLIAEYFLFSRRANLASSEVLSISICLYASTLATVIYFYPSHLRCLKICRRGAEFFVSDDLSIINYQLSIPLQGVSALCSARKHKNSMRTKDRKREMLKPHLCFLTNARLPLDKRSFGSRQTLVCASSSHRL